MRKIILICMLLFVSNNVLNAQVTLCLGQDATVCAGQTVQITNCSGGGPVLGSGITLDNATTIPQLSDDSFSALIPMGFTFNFYGTNYTNCVIGSNGLISFTASNANSGCAWSLVGMGTLPNTTLTTARNSAMLFYSDINPSQTPIGPIKYQTIGTAPNRKFVVLFESVNAFQCPNTCYYGAIIFYETSNLIDMMIGQKPNCTSWNGGLAIQGVENAAGTVATITPGRNNTAWNANQDGKRFTPIAPSNTSNYSVATVPYYTVTSTSNNSIQWANTIGGLFPYNNGVLNVTTIPPGTTGYYLTATACNAAVGGVSDTTFITRQVVTGTATAVTDYCFGGVGSATVNPTQGSAPFTYLWTPGGQTTQTATNLVSGPYTVHITDALGCGVNVNVNVPNTNATFSGSSTLVSCPGGNDGTATATMTPPLGVVSYNWFDAGGQITQTATGLIAGTYHCVVSTSISTGCTDTVEVIVSEIPGMVSTIINQVDVTCNSVNDGIIEVSVVAGTAPYTYSWNASPSTGPSANDLFAGTHTVTITDANNCVITTTATIGEPAALKITNLTPDTIICPESSITLNVQGTGGSSPYTFTWKENGAMIGTGTSITVDPANTATNYCVELTEQCGSPSTDSCMIINFPTPIVPLYQANKPYSCLPGDLIFLNALNNDHDDEVDSVIVDFGNGDMGVFYGDSNIAYTYTEAGIYTISVVTTSVRGCVTTATFPGIANVIANPVADFSMSANPTTIFETVVKMQDKSSPGVVNWTWSSPGSTPNNSTYENPTFHYPEGVVATYPIQLIVETAEGCIDTVERILSVNSDIIFYAPNAFTPDGDEFNQTWKFYVSGIDVYNFELMIFDRWGEIIWETHDPNAAWDGTYNGKIVPAGAYSWIARVKDIYSDTKKTFNGAINILK
ncbi:gliding motility-associated C-terminal domain-containing protein [Fluviicola taffensis]|uniref:T9SS type B sorting domain-containing protein n=1 Tax=Fluviicola taffensis TaxID=191579 RepID=UPI00313837D8